MHNGRAFEIPKAHIDKILDYYEWHDIRLSICTEECSELIKAISKHLRALKEPEKYSLDVARAMIVEEMTHVAISLAMLQRIFSIAPWEIDAEVRKKAKAAGLDDSDYKYSCQIGLDISSGKDVSSFMPISKEEVEEVHRLFEEQVKTINDDTYQKIVDAFNNAKTGEEPK